MTQAQQSRRLDNHQATIQAIAGATLACAQAMDGRGRWRRERSLVQQLAPGSVPRAADLASAAAARRIGEWLASITA